MGSPLAVGLASWCYSAAVDLGASLFPEFDRSRFRKDRHAACDRNPRIDQDADRSQFGFCGVDHFGNNFGRRDSRRRRIWRSRLESRRRRGHCSSVRCVAPSVALEKECRRRARPRSGASQHATGTELIGSPAPRRSKGNTTTAGARRQGEPLLYRKTPAPRVATPRKGRDAAGPRITELPPAHGVKVDPSHQNPCQLSKSGFPKPDLGTGHGPRARTAKWSGMSLRGKGDGGPNFLSEAGVRARGEGR